MFGSGGGDMIGKRGGGGRELKNASAAVCEPRSGVFGLDELNGVEVV